MIKNVFGFSLVFIFTVVVGVKSDTEVKSDIAIVFF